MKHKVDDTYHWMKYRLQDTMISHQKGECDYNRVNFYVDEVAKQIQRFAVSPGLINILGMPEA